MDGLIVLGASGRPIVLSRFRNRHAVYPLLHVDYLNSVLRKARASGSERDVPPVLVVPVAEDVLRAEESEESEESEEESEEESGEESAASESSKDMPNVWTADAPADAPPAPADDTHEGGAVLCHIKVGELRFLCPVSRDVDPLVPLEFLHRVVDVLQSYLAASSDPALMTEELICDHFDTVYELLEEMLDGDGNVLITETNALKDIVLPPSWLDRLVSTVGLGSASEQSRSALTSQVPWRRPNSKYAKNEFYLDFVEYLEGIVNAAGKPVALELAGRIDGTAWLSGVPELTVPLTKPELVQDAAWHACVRQKKWSSASVLNFLPPDGPFELGTYRIATKLTGDAAPALGRSALSSADTTLPLALDVQLDDWDAALGTHAFSITIESKLGAPRALTDLVVEWQLGERAQGLDAAVRDYGMPSTAHSVSHTSSASELSATQSGSVVFDRRRHLLRWTTPTLAAGACTKLQGTILAHGAPARPLYALQVKFTVLGHSLSGLRAKEIQMDHVNYAPTKGVRNVLSGALEWRRT